MPFPNRSRNTVNGDDKSNNDKRKRRERKENRIEKKRGIVYIKTLSQLRPQLWREASSFPVNCIIIGPC